MISSSGGPESLGLPSLLLRMYNTLMPALDMKNHNAGMSEANGPIVISAH
jgi:hypothetical protein